jgi:flagellar biosynthetic protein FlhB
VADGPDKESQTEEATEKRVSDAIEDGNLPVSREASIFATILCMIIVTGFMLRENARLMVLSLQHMFERVGTASFKNGPDAIELTVDVFRQMGSFIGPMLLIFIAGGLVASFAQHPPRLVLKRLQPDFSRISPMAGFGRMFSSKTVVEFLKSLAKCLTIGIIVFMLLKSDLNSIINAMFLTPDVIPDVMMSMALRLLSGVGVATCVLVVADVFWTKRLWRQSLRMSRQEIKDEFKQTQGDPLVKSRLRSLALDRARKSMIAGVPRATLVIANPTHFAIALRYVREEGGAPMVLAKGQDLIALKIREIAEQHDIPVIEDKALARSMYDHVNVDQAIPPDFYRAVAELIHFLTSRDGRRAVTR